MAGVERGALRSGCGSRFHIYLLWCGAPLAVIESVRASAQRRASVRPATCEKEHHRVVVALDKLERELRHALEVSQLDQLEACAFWREL